MMSFYMTSLHVDLNNAAKYVDIIPLTLLPPYHSFTHSYKIQNGDDIWPNLQRLTMQLMKDRGMKTWKKLVTGVQQLVRLLFSNNLIKPGLAL